MVQVGNYQQATGYYNNIVNKKEKQQTSRMSSPDRTSSAGYVDKNKEATLSGKAQDVLKMLREKYKNMDFMVAEFENEDDAKAILSRGTKEYSVLMSSDELEKMASDEKYLQERMDGIDGAVRMSKQINEQFGTDSDYAKENGVAVTRFGITLNDDGSTSFFAEMEKSNAKQWERIGKAREEKRAEQKAEDKKTEKELQEYLKTGSGIKKTTVSANSMEELINKIKNVDWDAVKDVQPENGGKYDFSI